MRNYRVALRLSAAVAMTLLLALVWRVEDTMLLRLAHVQGSFAVSSTDARHRQEFEKLANNSQA